jgi:hypothetical protein
MNIAFIHYHLKTGGVTTVLCHQINVLKKFHNILVLTGEPGPTPIPGDTVVIDGLSYDTPSRASPTAKDLADAVLTAIHSHFNGPCDLLHIHNPTIAKNRNFIEIIKRLHRTDIQLFLQIHDLAEDGRPALFYSEPYPSDCHYGVINRRDYMLLRKGGLNSEGLHLLPNMVEESDKVKETIFSTALPKTYVLYPVRAIRRKNIGEAILLSLFFQENETLVITLPPNSPADITAYDDWKRFVRANKMNVLFEAGLDRDFDQLVQNARFILTTSIAEGFGFSFLTPWLKGKLLWGRKLGDICCDFEEKGLVLDHLYLKLVVPLGWLPVDTLYSRWKKCMRRAASCYGLSIDDKRIDAAFASVTMDNQIDYGLLDESYQKEIIFRVMTDTSAANTLIQMNPFLEHPGQTGDADHRIKINCKAVAAHYNKTVYQGTLTKIYNRVLGIKVAHHLSSAPLLRYFLRPENFGLLKWCPYARE